MRFRRSPTRGVDGFAVQVADTAKTRSNSGVIGDIPPGTAPSMTIVTGTVVRIATGAPIPDGADGVVMVEDTETVGDRVRILWCSPRWRSRSSGGW